MDFVQYFQACDHYFWQWEENNTVIAIPNGNTIAYRDFVIDLLDKLSPQGVPPFGALLLAIMATNPTAKEDFETIDQNLNAFFQEANQDNSYFEGQETRNTAWKFLNRLTQLPEEYKKGKKRTLLFQTLFMNCHNGVSAKKALQILQSFDYAKDDLKAYFVKKPFNDKIFFKDFRVFRMLLIKFPSVKAIIEAVANLPTIEEDILLAPPTEDILEEKPLVDSLLEEAKTFHIGCLIPRLWSGLNISFQSHMPSNQALGGIADLTNKGNLDQLLVSEHAYDEWTFLSRLANNESLFLKKEAPPSDNRLERIILIDQSIKNWGTPRTIAYALMLAIANHPKAVTNCLAFAIGNEAKPIYFNSIEQIITSLEQLSPSLNCAEGLNDFLTSYNLKASSEVIFIGHKEALLDQAIQAVIQTHAAKLNYWMHPSLDGQIDIYRQSNQHKKLIQSFVLPLEQLWQKQKTPKEDANEEQLDSNYPILFPQALNHKKVLYTRDDELFIITAEKNLMHQIKGEKQKKKGWKLLYERLSVGNGLFEIGLHDNGDYILLAFDTGYKEGSLINLRTNEKQTIRFRRIKGGRFKDFYFYDNAFCFLTYTGYWRIEWGKKEAVFIDGTPSELAEAFNKHAEHLRELNKGIRITNSILKNIQHVDLNEEYHLVINKTHELSMNDYGVIKFYKNIAPLSSVSASAVVHKKEFTFLDGSKIYINRSGIMQLISSNKDIPTIYIPLTLDASLGVATKTAFAGNEYYLEHASNLNILKNRDFWTQYIAPFLQHIKLHET